MHGCKRGLRLRGLPQAQTVAGICGCHGGGGGGDGSRRPFSSAILKRTRIAVSMDQEEGLSIIQMMHKLEESSDEDGSSRQILGTSKTRNRR